MKKVVEKKIAELVKEKGGRTFYVGGYVRDKLLGINNLDVDIEIHGISESVLLEVLNKVGTPLKYGKSFGIYSLEGQHIDIALPRKEKAIGKGHRDFEITIDPFIGYKKAALRRDFTINALMEDVLTGEIVDNFDGLNDLKKKIIRHVDDKSFVEDPLRVLRACQFACRFDFKIANETINLCKNIDIKNLSKERIEEEIKKALIKGKKPSLFFEYLKKMNQLNYWFKEIKECINIKQDPIYHKEGDVYTHTMLVIDNASKYRNEVSNAYYFMLSALTHDLGKIVTTEIVDGRIHSYNHEEKGVEIAKTFLNRFTNNKHLQRYVLNMVKLHMKPNMMMANKSHIKNTNKMFDEAIAKKDLIYLAMADNCLIENRDNIKNDYEFLFKRLDIYEEYMKRPYVSGDDLIKAGLEADESFSDVLAFAHKLRLAGLDSNDALKQCLAYARKLKK